MQPLKGLGLTMGMPFYFLKEKFGNIIIWKKIIRVMGGL